GIFYESSHVIFQLNSGHQNNERTISLTKNLLKQLDELNHVLDYVFSAKKHHGSYFVNWYDLAHAMVDTFSRLEFFNKDSSQEKRVSIIGSNMESLNLRKVFDDLERVVLSLELRMDEVKN